MYLMQDVPFDNPAYCNVRPSLFPLEQYSKHISIVIKLLTIYALARQTSFSRRCLGP